MAKRLRNTCLSKIRKAKGDLIRNELDTNKFDSKKFWKSIHDIIPKNSKEKNKIELVDQTNKKEIPETDSAKFINDFFSTIGPNLAKKIDQAWDYNGKIADNTLMDIITNEEEVRNICKDIDTTKAACVENLSSNVLRDAFLALNRQLVYLINCIFKTGIFPNAWKLATVIPLFKGGNRNDVANFRPVSLLPLPSKIIERIIHNNILNYLETSNLLDINQGGFQKKTFNYKYNCEIDRPYI